MFSFCSHVVNPPNPTFSTAPNGSAGLIDPTKGQSERDNREEHKGAPTLLGRTIRLIVVVFGVISFLLTGLKIYVAIRNPDELIEILKPVYSWISDVPGLTFYLLTALNLVFSIAAIALGGETLARYFPLLFRRDQRIAHFKALEDNPTVKALALSNFAKRMLERAHWCPIPQLSLPHATALAEYQGIVNPGDYMRDLISHSQEDPTSVMI